MQVVNFGSEKFMDLVDALSMVVREVVHTHAGHVPFSRCGKQESPTSGQDTNGYVSPYIVDPSEDEPTHYDPAFGHVRRENLYKKKF